MNQQPTYTDCSNCGTADHNHYACACDCHPVEVCLYVYRHRCLIDVFEASAQWLASDNGVRYMARFAASDIIRVTVAGDVAGFKKHYSDPKRENEPHALPDVEVWSDFVTIVRSKCGEFEVARESESARGFCPSCERATCVLDLDTFDKAESGIEHTERIAWWWWSCFPGCLPDSEPFGPFATEADALADAREGCED